MYIYKISEQNYSANFKGIYRIGKDLSPAQKGVADSIAESLKKTSPKLKGESAEHFYKEKCSMDFVIEPGGYNSIILNGARNATVHGDDDNRTISYSNPIFIGEYGGTNKFQVEDIDQGIAQTENADLKKGLSYAALLGGMILAFWLAAKIEHGGDNNAAKQDIQNEYSLPVNDSTQNEINLNSL